MRRCICCDAVITELLSRASLRVQRRRRGASENEAKKQVFRDVLTMSLLRIAAATRGGGAPVQAVRDAPPRREWQANDWHSSLSDKAKSSSGTSAEGTPRFLRALLLKSRKENAVVHDAKRVPHAPTAAKLLTDAEDGLCASETLSSTATEGADAVGAVATWYAAFQLFSEAVEQHTVVPSIEHINVLLGITVREKRWQQMQQLEMFLEKILVSECGMCLSETPCKMDSILDVSGSQQTAFPLQPNSETYEWLMAAAVSRGDWVEALRCFDDVRDEYLPVSDSLLKLALEAYRIGGVHSLIDPGGNGHTNKKTTLAPLRTDYRGPFLHCAASARPASTSHGVRTKPAAASYLWEAALMLFSSFLHRVQESDTVALFMSMMADAGKHQVLLDTYRDRSRTVNFGEEILPLVSNASREVGDWALNLCLLQHILASPADTERAAVGRQLLVDALLVLRRTQHYQKIIGLHVQVPSRMWTSRARVMVAQTAMVQRDLPLLLWLFEEEETMRVETNRDDDGGRRTSHIMDTGLCYPFGIAAVSPVYPSFPVEMYDIALRTIQLELIHRRFHSTPLRESAVSRLNIPQDLAALSIAIYEKFLRDSKHQISTNEGVPFDASLSVYAPFVKLLQTSANEGAGVGRCTNGLPEGIWEKALSHVALIRRPDTIVVSLVTHLLQRENQWEAAFNLLSHVIRSEEVSREADGPSRRRHSRLSSPNGVKVDEANHSDRYTCTAITAVAIRYAVWSAVRQPSAAVHLTQRALATGWIDGSMAMQLLEGVEGILGKEEQLQDHWQDHDGNLSYASNDAVHALLKLVAMHDKREGGLGSFGSLFLKTLQLLQQLQTRVEPPTSLLSDLTGNLEEVVSGLAKEGNDELRAKAELVVPVVLHAVWHQISMSHMSRWTLWQECLRCLRWFCSPLSQHSSFVLQANESTLRVLRAFIRRCDRPEEGFVESVAVSWLLVEASPSALEKLLSLLDLLPDLVDRAVWLSHELLLDALVWCGRHRVKGLLRRLARILLPLFLKILQRGVNSTARKATEPRHCLRSETLTALTVAVQCLTSGPHEEVLHDWPLVHQLLSLLLQANEFITAADTAQTTTPGRITALAESLAAVLDKLRRTFHFLTMKISLDAHRRRSQGSEGISFSRDDEAKHLTSVLESGAIEYMDLCEAFAQRFFTEAGVDWMALGAEMAACLEKVMNCVWDVNYTLYVWYTTFSPFQSGSSVLKPLQKRYRWLMCLCVLFLPASCITPLRVGRWLVVMSGDGESAATLTQSEIKGTETEKNMIAALLHDITTLEAWQRCQFTTISHGGEGSCHQSRQLIVPLVLEAIHSITIGVSEHVPSSFSQPTTNLAAAAVREALPPLKNGCSARTPFDDHIALVSPWQLRTMQKAGCTLIYMLLCEGQAELPQMAQKAMSWSCCSHALLEVIVSAAQSTSAETFKALWTPVALVDVFGLLKAQNCFWALFGRPQTAGGSQASRVLSLLTASPAVRAATRMDEDICTAALLALDPVDVMGDAEHVVAVRHTVCRLLAAFPKILEKRLLLLLLAGQLDDLQLTVMDILLQHIVKVTGGRSLGCSPTLMRSIAMWLLLRPPCVAPCVMPCNAAPLQMFSDIMISGELRSADHDRRMTGTMMRKEQAQNVSSSSREKSEEMMKAAHIRRWLGWEKAVQLLNDALQAETPHVDLNKAFFGAMEIYGTYVSRRWEDDFFKALLEQNKRNPSSCNHTSSLRRLMGELIDHVAYAPSLQQSLFRHEPVEPSELRQVGEKLWKCLGMACKEQTVTHADVWKSVFVLLQRVLQNNLPFSCQDTGELVFSLFPVNCLMVERLVPHLLRHGVVRNPSLPEKQESVVDIPLVASSMLLMLEMAFPGRAVNMVLYRLYEKVLGEEAGCDSGSVTPPLSSSPAPVTSRQGAWRSLIECAVYFLTLPGLLDGSITENISTSGVAAGNNNKGNNAARVRDAFSTTGAVVGLVFRFICDDAVYVLSTDDKLSHMREDNMQECLLRLLELSGRCVASLATELLLLSGTKRMEEDSAAMKRIVALFLQSALLMGSWRDIYWLSSRLLVSVSATLQLQRGEEAKSLFVSSWCWIVGCLPAMVAGSSRTSSSLHSQVTALLKMIPAAFLQQNYLATAAAIVDKKVFGDGCVEARQRQLFYEFLMRLHERILLKAETTLRDEGKRAASFTMRLSVIRPVVQVGVLLGLHNVGAAEAEKLRSSLLFFLADDLQWRRLLEAVKAECKEATTSKDLLKLDAANGGSAVPSWQVALELLCLADKELFQTLSLKNGERKAGAEEIQKIKDALHVFHVSCFAQAVPWEVAIDLFRRDDGPPHTALVFPASYTEQLIRHCPSWSMALELFKYSLSRVPHPTKVQQLLAYLILYRMRTDPTWGKEGQTLLPHSYNSGGKEVGLLSWEVACWCYNQLTQDRAAPTLPQRNMIEILRHCVFSPSAALSMYEAYWKQEYRLTEGVNVFLSLLRAARLARNEELVLRAMWDYIRCCDEHDGVISKTSRGPVRHHMFTAGGNATLCRSFTHVCESNIVSRQAAMELVTALKQRGRIGEMEELLMVTSYSRGVADATEERAR
ncbi:hypothetical protein, conserved [Trypanosoma cruzi]|uniref:Uncharacterized protein n=1 Tax=Trypanosoma cruzi (strain CL Brener) TaxID=353153 RepID=Q4D4Q8_TRYCC|nr:hypothetical protein, conserved [Trypanosoma cruzi]EAN87511.1 hypothetical protein, conserved [Trypanosoma cruzi]|eukprot:XP_809362.1 hypothetical protein [Trypanosoma cruzi strain CL Brener]